MANRRIPRQNERPGFQPVDESEVVNKPTPPGGSRIDLKRPDKYVPWPMTSPTGALPARPPVQGTLPGWAATTSPTRAQAEARWQDLSPADRASISALAKRIDYRKTGAGLWKDWVAAAEESSRRGDPKTPFDYANQSFAEFGGTPDGQGPTGSRRGSGRAAAYSGPVESVTKLSEADITRMAYDAAEALLGRQPTQAEINKIIKKTRKAETAQPDVRTQEGPGRSVTQQGLSKEGRDAILSEVLMSSPDYANYQIDSTVLDMMLNNLRRGQQVARGS
jgi:hypothetical protein